MRKDSDSLILVDEADHGVGHLSKVLCHEGRGILHRSCCSHPRKAETLEAAAQRRLVEELGLRCPLHYLFKFRYQAQFDETGAENELCSVYIGRSTDAVRINTDEILAWRWISPEALHQEMAQGGGNFTPWFKIEWDRVWRDHRAQVLDLQSELGTLARSR